MKRLVQPAIATFVGFVVSSIVVGSSCALGRCLSGGGYYNLKLIIYLSVPFVLVLGFAAAVQPTSVTGGKHRVTTAVLVGAALGLLYAFLLFGFMRLGFLGMAVDALACWMAGGISAMLALAATGRLRKVSAIAGVCLLAILLPRPLFNVLAHNQQLTVAFVTPSSGSEETVPFRTVLNRGEGAEAVSKQILEHVYALGLAGKFRVAYLVRQGEGKPSLAIIVVQGPVEQRTFLAEPNGSTVIYVQQSGSWTKHPSDAPTLKRSIEIWSRKNSGEIVSFSIPYAWGTSLLGGIREDTKDRSLNP